MSTTQEKIAVMQAYVDGVAVQVLDSHGWNDLGIGNPMWNWDVFDYRIKPTPVECWVWQFESGGIGSAFHTKESAEKIRADNPCDGRLMHMREII
jgi:hypothetical protein